ncbi:MAG: Eco29kI family restriction endonuclease [Bryobacter sp.]|nr:Eco29kI family restriction endonuclease [Bryobacter sp.]
MRTEPVFNPLDKKNLGSSVAEALVLRERSPLPPRERFIAAGVYAIYYQGDHPLYTAIATKNRANNGDDLPIYVGKAIPKGARKGGTTLDRGVGTVLFDRLKQHSETIQAAQDLKLSDFFCRYLAVDDIWIPLGENLLIEEFSPLWNKVVEGFGNHDPGSGRERSKMSPWDIIHPGRSWALKLQPGKDRKLIEQKIRYFLAKQFGKSAESS